MEDKANRSRFFQETFLIANIKFEVILGILFLKLSNADVLFGEKALMWRTYTINKALITTEQVQIIDKKDFVMAALDANSKMFVVHVAIWKQEEMPMHSKRQAQVGALLFNKAPTKVLAEYSDYNNVFSAEYVAELPGNTKINKYAIELEEGKQPLFGPI